MFSFSFLTSSSNCGEMRVLAFNSTFQTADYEVFLKKNTKNYSQKMLLDPILAFFYGMEVV